MSTKNKEFSRLTGDHSGYYSTLMEFPLETPNYFVKPIAEEIPFDLEAAAIKPRVLQSEFVNIPIPNTFFSEILKKSHDLDEIELDKSAKRIPELDSLILETLQAAHISTDKDRLWLSHAVSAAMIDSSKTSESRKTRKESVKFVPRSKNELLKETEKSFENAKISDKNPFKKDVYLEESFDLLPDFADWSAFPVLLQFKQDHPGKTAKNYADSVLISKQNEREFIYAAPLEAEKTLFNSEESVYIPTKNMRFNYVDIADTKPTFVIKLDENSKQARYTRVYTHLISEQTANLSDINSTYTLRWMDLPEDVVDSVAADTKSDLDVNIASLETKNRGMDDINKELGF